jgi:hypothetical protein
LLADRERSRRADLRCGQDGDGRRSGALFGARAGAVPSAVLYAVQSGQAASMDAAMPPRLRALFSTPLFRQEGIAFGPPYTPGTHPLFGVLEKIGFRHDHIVTDEQGELVYMVRDDPSARH